MNSNETMVIEKDKLLSEKSSIAEVKDDYFVDISKSLNLKDSSESNADNTVSNIMHLVLQMPVCKKKDSL